MMRVRFTFAKTEWLRYIGHLDLHHIFIRTFRRAGLALVHSQGFHPQPKIHLASALALGYTGSQEMIECWLVDDLDLTEIESRMRQASHPGIQLIKLDLVPPKTEPLQVRIDSSIYSVLIPADCLQSVGANLDHLLAQDEIIAERKGKLLNIRPFIQSITLPTDGSAVIMMKLQSGEGTTGRVDEVLKALGIDPLECLVNRDEILLKPSIVANE